MNYETTPTPYKPAPSSNRKDSQIYYGGQQDDSWVTNASTPSTVDSTSFNGNSNNNRPSDSNNVSPIDDEMQQRQ